MALPAAATLQQLALPETEIRFGGQVVELRRSRRDEPTAVIETSSLSIDFGERLRRVWVTLSADQYRLAVKAHADERKVFVLAKVSAENRRLVARDVSEFGILESIGQVLGPLFAAYAHQHTRSYDMSLTVAAAAVLQAAVVVIFGIFQQRFARPRGGKYTGQYTYALEAA